MINLDRDELYPLLFVPRYKTEFWGGRKFADTFGRELPVGELIGESWEISDRPEWESPVSNGSLAGVSLTELIARFGQEIVGPRFQGGRFPLMVKLIDAERRLSLLVHPNESTARQLGNGLEPKSKLWYILDAEPGSKIIAGISPRASKVHFIESLKNHTIEAELQCFESSRGDAYFLNAGKVHSLSAGNLILSIEQNSDSVFKISDWGRSLIEPNAFERGLACVDFMDRALCRTTAVSDQVERNRKFPLLNRCPAFNVDELILSSEWHDSTDESGSFHLLSAAASSFKVGHGNTVTQVPYGSTCLIPACFGSYIITPEPGKQSVIIKSSL